jgi:hypothetical protein
LGYRIFVFVLILLYAITSSSSIAYAALSPDQIKVLQTGIKYFDVQDDAAGDSTTCGDQITLDDGSDNAKTTWDFFLSNGLKPWQAAGFMGNMKEEAHFEPRLVEYGWKNSRGEKSVPGKPSSYDDSVPPDQSSKGEPGYGIIQWTSPGRKQGLRNKVTSDPQHRLASNMTLQLEYMLQELRGPYKKSTLDPVMSTATVEQATATVTNNYEIPAGNRSAKIASRTKAARGFLVIYGSTTPTTTPPVPAAVAPTTPDSSSSCVTALTSISGSIAIAVVKAIQFSWPEKRGLIPKPEYAAAVRQFNPGASQGGADCGAFIGTVMHASGADTGYPLGGTSAQLAYVKKHPEKYDVTDNFTLADLLPGDILIVDAGGNSRYGHTYMFVGNQGGGKNKADASIGSRMPALGVAEVVDSSGRGHYTRARLK